MKTTEVNLGNLNKIDDEFIVSIVEKRKGIIKVTSTTYYQTYEGDVETIELLAKEWFEKYASGSHAYRDGSKLPFENLISVEIIKK